LARGLDGRERQALDWLRAAGASRLPDRFSDVDLKSAFRLLARRFHPDARPEVPVRQRDELAADFRQLVVSYRLLRACIAG
jgi:hypothetical protein